MNGFWEELARMAFPFAMPDSFSMTGMRNAGSDFPAKMAESLRISPSSGGVVSWMKPMSRSSFMRAERKFLPFFCLLNKNHLRLVSPK